VVGTNLGQSLLFGNVTLLEYGGVVWLLFHGFVLVYEEPTPRQLWIRVPVPPRISSASGSSAKNYRTNPIFRLNPKKPNQLNRRKRTHPTNPPPRPRMSRNPRPHPSTPAASPPSPLPPRSPGPSRTKSRNPSPPSGLGRVETPPPDVVEAASPVLTSHSSDPGTFQAFRTIVGIPFTQLPLRPVAQAAPHGRTTTRSGGQSESSGFTD
jgi:hypothetical protein